jgi:hypothetical protein
VFDVGMLIVFLAASSLEFPVKIFLASCARKTLINEWHIPWVNLDKWMEHPLNYP